MFAVVFFTSGLHVVLVSVLGDVWAFMAVVSVILTSLTVGDVVETPVEPPGVGGGHSVGRDTGEPFGRVGGELFGRDTVEPFGRDTGEQFGRDTGVPFGRTGGELFGRDTGEPFGRDSSEQFGRDTGEPFGRDTGVPFGRAGGELFGRAGGELHGRGSFLVCFGADTTCFTSGVDGIALPDVGDTHSPAKYCRLFARDSVRFSCDVIMRPFALSLGVDVARGETRTWKPVFPTSFFSFCERFAVNNLGKILYFGEPCV